MLIYSKLHLKSFDYLYIPETRCFSQSERVLYGNFIRTLNGTLNNPQFAPICARSSVGRATAMIFRSSYGQVPRAQINFHYLKWLSNTLLGLLGLIIPRSKLMGLLYPIKLHFTSELILSVDQPFRLPFSGNLFCSFYSGMFIRQLSQWWVLFT